MREERTMHSNLFDTYLPEFMWRCRFNGPETFSNIVKHIAEYPGNILNCEMYIVS